MNIPTCFTKWSGLMVFVTVSAFSFAFAAFADEPSCKVDEFESNSRQTELQKLYESVLPALKKAAGAGLCDPDVIEAAEYAYGIVMSKANDDYKRGEYPAVWSENRGLVGHFNEIKKHHPELEMRGEDFLDRISALDKEYPVTKFNDRTTINGGAGVGLKPHIDYTARYNAFDEAMKVASSNTFRAATLLGMIGHDDIYRGDNSDFIRSNLFAKGNIGESVKVDPNIEARYIRGINECISNHEPDSLVNPAACQGAGGAHAYHMIAGFYLGCQLVKSGFTTAMVPKLIADLASDKVSNGLATKDWKMVPRDILKGRFCDKYEIDLSVDFPGALAATYKKATMPKFLSSDAAALFEAGYIRAFQPEEKEFKLFLQEPFKSWDEPRRLRAIGNLDLRLTNMEYTIEQHRVGAAFGAKVCREYKESIRPEPLIPPVSGVDSDASMLFHLGYFNLNAKIEDLARHQVKGWSVERKRKALTRLHELLRPIKDKLGFEDQPIAGQ